MANKNSNITKITNFSDLQEYARGQVVQLPDFAENQPFVARLSRPSMLALAKAGKIPNSLLVSANELFAEGTGSFDPTKESMMDDMFSVIDVLCDACFVEPTYQEIKDSGITLTDEQYMFIFNYSQEGVKALENFR